jgi:DNA-binding response OmpR family regulator
VIVARILVVEDDEHLARGIELHLAKEGFEVTRVRNGETAVAMVLRQHFDLITLDVMLPGLTGVDVCRELRRQGIDTPIVMLTARADELDRVLGLELGADDYMTKPFSARELVARIRARLRRAIGRSEVTTRVRFGRVEVDLGRYLALRDGQPIDLTAREFDILRLLIRNRGEVVSRNRILDEVWPAEISLSPRTVDTHILNLRRKVEDDAASPQYIQSVYGEGYRFVG